MLYEYKVIDENGNILNGTIEAKLEDDVFEKFKRYYIVKISPVYKGYITKERYYGRLKKSEIARFFSDLSNLLNAGVPLLASLNILFEETQNKRLKKVLNRAIIEVEKGNNLSVALGKFKTFDRFCITAIKVGEESGKIVEILSSLSEHMKKENDMRSKVKSALTYPFIVVFVMSCVLLLFIFFVFPKFALFYKSINAELPLITKIILALPIILKRNFLYPVFLIIFLYIVYLISRLYRFRKYFDNLRFRLPIFGPLYRKINIYFFSQYLKFLVESGVPILPSLNIAKEIVSSVNMKEAIEKSENYLRSGNSLSTSLKNYGYFPLSIIRIIKVGEETGNLETSLNDIIELYGKEIDATLNNLSAIIEPFVLVVLGLFVGLIALSLYLPIFNLIKYLR